MLEYGQCKEIDDDAVDYVNQDIYKMIAEDIEFPKFVVKGKGETYNSSGVKELLERKIISQVSNLCTFCNT